VGILGEVNPATCADCDQCRVFCLIIRPPRQHSRNPALPPHGRWRRSPQGKLNLPLLDAINVAGMTVSEAETCIADAYIKDNLLAHPIVEITTPAGPSTPPKP
jgi:hypothetical protein